MTATTGTIQHNKIQDKQTRGDASDLGSHRIVPTRGDTSNDKDLGSHHIVPTKGDTSDDRAVALYPPIRETLDQHQDRQAPAGKPQEPRARDPSRLSQEITAIIPEVTEASRGGRKPIDTHDNVQDLDASRATSQEPRVRDDPRQETQ